ncbi:hypothetical protein ACLOJK_032821 [Asimina triloba]
MSDYFFSLLPTCKSLNFLKSIHARLVTAGYVGSSDVILNRIVRSYGRLGAVDHARRLFDQIPQPNAFIWTALIHAHVENSLHDDAVLLFHRMRTESVPPLNFTVSLVLKALARRSVARGGQTVHGLVLKYGLGSDLNVQNSVIDMYSRFGEVDVARRVFDGVQCKDIVSWNSMISGYCVNGRIDVARGLFEQMPERNVVSWTAMISGYASAGNMAEAQFLFGQMPVRDSASWNVILTGYLEAGDIKAASSVFEEMPKRDIWSWNAMISSLCKVGELNLARDFFDRMPMRNVVSWTMMLDGYIRKGDVELARCLFDQMPEKSLVTWSTMISGYAKNGQPNHALELFKQFKKKGIKPDETFILVIISTCSQVGVLDTAETIIRENLEHSHLSNLKVVTSLIDMYAKCGSIEKAVQIFEQADNKDLICYSAMITAFANHGMCQNAINLLNELQKANTNPDGVTFLSVLSACNHAGLIDEGQLEEAFKLVTDLPVQPHAAVWGALLAACRVYCNVELAEVAATVKQWDAVAKVRSMIREKGVRKNRASSWIELDSVVHEFVMGDMSSLDDKGISTILDLLVEDMKNLGCDNVKPPILV